MLPISGKTTVYGIVGDPVAHSLSPRMHAAFAAAAGVDMVYVPFPVAAADLPAAVRGLLALGVRGVNVTIPHKEAVCALADRLSVEAQGIGAANTLLFENKQIFAHNTDAEGFSRSLDDSGLDWRCGDALVIGSGGAARAILWTLGVAGMRRIYLANRTIARAEALAQCFSAFPIQPIPLTSAAISPLLTQVSLLVNTSSRGLHGEGHPEIDLARLPGTGIVCDIVYNPMHTPLLMAAASMGLATVDGLGMLIQQGAASFALWTGHRPSTAGIRETLTAWLQPNPPAPPAP